MERLKTKSLKMKRLKTKCLQRIRLKTKSLKTKRLKTKCPATKLRQISISLWDVFTFVAGPGPGQLRTVNCCSSRVAGSHLRRRCVRRGSAVAQVDEDAIFLPFHMVRNKASKWNFKESCKYEDDFYYLKFHWILFVDECVLRAGGKNIHQNVLIAAS